MVSRLGTVLAVGVLVGAAATEPAQGQAAGTSGSASLAQEEIRIALEGRDCNCFPEEGKAHDRFTLTIEGSGRVTFECQEHWGGSIIAGRETRDAWGNFHVPPKQRDEQPRRLTWQLDMEGVEAILNRVFAARFFDMPDVFRS